MSNTNTVYKFGPFQLETESDILYREGRELSVEPKLIEVLCYLIVQRDRYVPLAELHNELWAGRIVTDTAVRRTISKLRSILEDDTYNPQFIKSLPKRGYKMVAPVELLPELTGIQLEIAVPDEAKTTLALKNPKTATNDDNDAKKESLDQSKNLQGETSQTPKSTENSTQNTIENDSDSNQGHSADDHILETRGAGVSIAPNTRPQINTPNFKITSLQITCVAIFLIIVSAFLFIDINQTFEQQSVKNDPLVKSIEVIETFPSNKTDLDISEDGTKLAFTARMSENMGYQLFIKDLETGSIEQFTNREENLEDIQFLPGSQEIIYTSFEENSIKLKRRALNQDSNEVVSTIYESDGFMVGLFRQDIKSGLFIREWKNNESIEKIKKIDLTTGSVSDHTLTDDLGRQLKEFRYSPDGKKLAYSDQTSRDSSKIQLRVKHLDTNIEYALPFSHKLGPQFLKKFEWLDNNHLVILTSKAIYKMDSTTLKYEEILKNPNSRYWNIKVASYDEIFLIRNEPVNRYVVEIDTESLEVTRQFHIGDLRVPNYGPNNSIFAITYNENGYTLINYNPETKKEKVLMHTANYSIVVGSLDKDFEKPIIMDSETAFIYNTIDESRIEITKTGPPLITFEQSNSYNKVFYNEISEGIRKVGYFDITTGEKVFLKENAIIAGESNEGGYFFIQIDGSVLKTDINLNKIALIDAQLPEIFKDEGGNYRLLIRDNKMIWSQTQNAERTFNILDLDTNKLNTKIFPIQNTVPLAVPSSNGKRMMIIREEERTEIIEKVILN